MAAPAVNLDKPVFADPVDDSLDHVRDNQIWLVIALAINGVLIPGWDSAPSGTDLSKPDDVILIGPGSRKIRLTYTYTDDDVTKVVVEYDKGLGSGYEALTLGTGTIAYNASGEWTGTAWT